MTKTETIRIEINGRDTASPALKQISTNLGLLEQKLATARRAFETFNQTVDKAFKVTATVMASATGALTATTYFGAKVEKSFQNAYTMFDITEEAFKKLKNEIIDLSVPAGKSAKELADALYLVGSAGIDASKAVDVLKTTAIAAVAGNTDMSTAFQSAIGQINAFGLSIEDLTRVYAMNFEVVQKGQLDYEQLAQTFGVISSSATQLGVSLRESLAAYTTLTTVNIDPARAATFTAAAFRDMVAKSEELKKMGVYVFDAQGNFRGLKNVVYDLKKALEGLTKEEQNALLQQIGFAAEASQGISNWVNSYEKLDEIMNSIQGNTEALQDAYKKQTNSVQFLIDQLRSAVGKLNLAFFEATRSGVVQILQKLIGWIQGITRYIQVNSEQIGKWIWAFMRLGTVVLVGLGALKVFMPVVQALIGLMSPAKIAFAGFAMALLKVWNSLDPEKRKSAIEGMKKIFDWFVEKAKIVIGWLTEMKSAEDFMTKFAALSAGLGIAVGFAGNIPKWLLEGAREVAVNLVKGVVTLWGWFVDAAKTIFVALAKGAVALWKWFVDAVRTVAIALVEGVVTLWKWFVDAVRTIAVAVIEGTITLWKWFVNAVRTVAIAVIEGTITLWKWFVNAIRTVAIAVVEGTITLWKWFVNAARTITVAVVEGTVTLWKWFTNAIRTITVAVIEGTVALWKWFVDAIKTVSIAVVEGAVALWGWFVDGVRTVAITLKKALKAGIDWLWNGARTVAVTLTKALKAGITWLWEGARTIAITLKKAVEAGILWLWEGTKTIAITLKKAVAAGIAWLWEGARKIAITATQGAVNLWKWFIDKVRTISVSLKQGTANVWPWLLGGTITIVAAIQLAEGLAEGSISPEKALYSLLAAAAAGLGVAIFGGPAAGFVAFGVALWLFPKWFGKEKTPEQNISDIQKELEKFQSLMKSPVLNTAGYLVVAQQRAEEITKILTRLMDPEVYKTLPDALKQQIEGLWGWLQKVNAIYTQLEMKIISAQEAAKKLKELSVPKIVIVDAITGAAKGGQSGGYFATGGYTGYGAWNDVAGVVHKGEYVIPAWMVKKMPEVVALLEAKRLRGYQEGGGDILGAVTAYLFGSPDAADDIATLSEDAQVILDVLKSILDILNTTNPEIVEQLKTQLGAGGEGSGEGSDKRTAGKRSVWEVVQNAFDTLGEGFKKIFDFIGGIVGVSAEQLAIAFGSISKLLDPMTTVLMAMLNVLAPVVNDTLAPLVGILQLVGELIGKLLAPMIQLLGIVIEPVAKAFVWLYNKVFIPIGNFILGIFKGIGEVLKKIPFLESVGNTLANIELLSTINYADLTAAGGAGSTYGTTTPTSLGSVTSSGPETINIYISENIIGTEEEFQKIVLRALEKAGIATGGAAISVVT